MAVSPQRLVSKASQSIPSIYAPLLRLCSKRKALADGQRIHSLLRKTGDDKRVFLANLLIQMYGSCGSLQQARSVFDELETHNIYSWNLIIVAYTQQGQLLEARKLFNSIPEPDTVAGNAMVAAYSRAGQMEEARNLFDKLPQRNVVSWNTVITAYAHSGHLLNGREFFDKMPERNVVSYNTIIKGYGVISDIHSAREMFDELPEKDEVSWTAIAAANTHCGYVSESVNLFLQMDLEGAPSNPFTFTSMVDACGEAGKIKLGREVHEEIQLHGLENELNVGNALVNMYCKFSDVSKAKKLFDSMPQTDLVTWTSLIIGYAGNGHLLQAKEMFDRAPKSDVVLWTSLIDMFSRSGALEEAEELFHSTPGKNVVTWNAMMSGFALGNQHKKSLKLFRVMDLEGVQADRASFVIILDACTSSVSVVFGKIVHSLLDETRVSQDVELSTCLVNLYAKCGRLEAAREIFNSMPRVDLVPWNVMITAYGERGCIDSTIELLSLMVQEGFFPDEITSVGVISACSRAGTLRDGRYHFLAFAADYGVKPVIDNFICMMDLLGRAGLLDEVEDLMRNMPFESDDTVLLAFLSACKLHGDLKRASGTAELMFKLEDCKITSAPFLLLSGAFSGN